MKIAIHICCANCGTVVVERLKDRFDLTLFWYNPNIQPKREYKKRLVDVKRLAKIYSIPLIIGNYEVKKWFNMIRGFEKEPEGGKRCLICFKMRLEETVKYAQKNNFDYFTTTLTVGPQKNAKVINEIGKEIAQKYNLNFYEADFKKKDGFKRSVELSKKYNFYRQNYCGCIFSLPKNRI